MACLTGNGTTLTLGTALTATLVDLGDISESGVAIDDNDLVAGTLDKKCAGDLITFEPFDFTVKYLDADAGDIDTHPVYTATTLQVTFAGGDTYSFTTGTGGFILARTITGIDNNNRVLVNYTYQPVVAGVYAAA